MAVLHADDSFRKVSSVTAAAAAAANDSRAKAENFMSMLDGCQQNVFGRGGVRLMSFSLCVGVLCC